MEHEIVNHRHLRDYTIIPNALLQDTSLSFFTKGLLVYLLSLPEDWAVRVDVVVAKFGEKESRILKALRELIALGYCKRTPKRDASGKVCGQRYQISDIAGDFTAPQKNGGTVASAAPANLPPTEKNGGRLYNDNKENSSLFNKEDMEGAVVADDTHPARGAHLFKNSPFYEFEKFAVQFTAPEFAEIDLLYYYNCIRDWSQEGGKKKHDWIATARNWMRRDRDSGRLHKTPHAGLTPDAIKYLQDMAPSDFELGIRR